MFEVEMQWSALFAGKMVFTVTVTSIRRRPTGYADNRDGIPVACRKRARLGITNNHLLLLSNIYYYHLIIHIIFH
jgi:hypothetical protein